MSPPVLAGVLTAAITLGACGRSDVAIVKAPVGPIYACSVRLASGASRRVPGCKGPFDAGRMVGTKFKDAMRLAAASGFTIRRAAPLGKDEALTDEFAARRIDVECSEASDDSTVVRIMGRG